MSKFEEPIRENEPPAPSETESKRAWERVRKVRCQIADEIDSMASQLESKTRVWLQQVSSWLRGSAEYEQALAQPMVLAICLPISRKLMDREREVTATVELEDRPSSELAKPAEPVSPSEIQQAVRWGFRQVIGRQKSVSWRIFGLLLYPLIAILLAWTLWIATCFTLLPQIEDIFEGFSMNLPHATQLLIWSSSLVRDWWAIMILVPLICVLWFFGMNYVSPTLGRSKDQGSWLDRKLTGNRNVIANWAWHLSLLLDWGLATKSAVMVAGMCSQRGWLQQSSLDWIGESFDPLQDRRSKNTLVANHPRMFLSRTRFQLVNHAMALPDRNEKILLLREISNYYQERGSSFTEWMIAWIATLLIWIAFGIVLMILFSVYSPLFQLLSLLT